MLSPALLAKWTGDGTSDGTVFGMTIPAPQSPMNMALISWASTFSYVSARPVGDDDDDQRDFLDPLIGDMHVTLIARNRCRGANRAAG